MISTFPLPAASRIAVRARLQAFVCALGLLLLTGCAGFGAVSESLFMISPEEEEKLGQQFAAELEKELVFVNDPAVVNYVRTLGQREWAASQQGLVPPDFYVVKDDELNAFAIPGGNVYVHTGLIEAADDEAELAAVIGHELGHVSMRHGARHLSRQQGLALVQQLALGEEAGQISQMVGSLLATGVMTSYSREDESEADAIGVGTLNNLSYDPLAMRTFFQKLEDKYGSGGGAVGKLFASHPPTPERMAHVSQMVAQLPKKQFTRPTADLARTKARLKALGL